MHFTLLLVEDMDGKKRVFERKEEKKKESSTKKNIMYI